MPLIDEKGTSLFEVLAYDPDFPDAVVIRRLIWLAAEDDLAYTVTLPAARPVRVP